VSIPSVPDGTWTVDPLFSNIGYEVKHFGLVTSRGWFRGFSGAIEAAGGRIAASGWVEPGSLETGDWARDEHVKGRLFLAFEDFGRISFESTSFEVDPEGGAVLKGMLDLHGVRREIELEGRVEGLIRDGGGRDRIGVALDGAISRRAFNLRFDRRLPSGDPLVSDEVKLILELTATRDDRAAVPEPDGADVVGDALLQRVSNPAFGNANTYLVGDLASRKAVLVDAGGPVEPVLATIDAQGLELTHVLLTHDHLDHVAELDAVRERHPDAEVLVHAADRPGVGLATGTVHAGEAIETGGLRVEVLSTPGHTAGGVSFLVNGRYLFSGDTLYRDTISTVEMTGHTTFADLRRGIEGLLALPGEVEVLSGHGEPTTISREIDENPFVRVMLGTDPEGTEECTALGRKARIVVLGTDGHGSERVWIRWEDGVDDVVPGLVLERAAEA